MRMGHVFSVGLLAVLLPAAAFGQNNICRTASPSVPDQARAEQLRIEAAERAQREVERRGWEVKMVPVKYAFSEATLKALCIFQVEVVAQPTLRVVQIRAPKELMAAVEDALKRLDVPEVSPKTVEVTAYILSSNDRVQGNQSPLPASLQPVANQLKGLVLNGDLFLADTIVARGIEGQYLRVGGTNQFNAQINVREGNPSVVRLDSLQVSTLGAQFNTSVDVPVGAQVVVGKVTANTGEAKPSVILVVTAKILE